MRPRGEIRQALAAAARALHAERGHFTHVQLAERAQVGYELARRTVDNMADGPRAELVRVGHEKATGSRVYMTLFEVASLDEPPCAAAELDQVIRCWSEFV